MAKYATSSGQQWPDRAGRRLQQRARSIGRHYSRKRRPMRNALRARHKHRAVDVLRQLYASSPFGNVLISALNLGGWPMVTKEM